MEREGHGIKFCHVFAGDLRLLSRPLGLNSITEARGKQPTKFAVLLKG